MTFEDLENKRFGLLIKNIDTENDVRILYGKILNDDSGYYFTNQSETIRITIDHGLLKRVKEVDDKMRNDFETFKDCDYILLMTMGNLEDEVEEMNDTGLNWQE